MLESTKRQRNRWRAYVPFALSHLDCSAPNGQMIVWSNGHATRWRERSIARGSNSAPPVLNEIWGFYTAPDAGVFETKANILANRL